MSEDVVRVEKVWKAYEKAGSIHLKSLLLGLEQPRPEREEWALKDISFSVPKGESFGIVGHNGSGKTTLLSILLGAIPATRGEARVEGRIASLLALGSGFTPDLTGRENVYLYASILGMRRAEVDARIESIIAFAELWDVIDYPLRVYSTGMNARLGFSTIIHTPAEVLLIDEILGVGDEHFREKCGVFFRDFRSRGGTLVTVSHSLATVLELCDRGLYLRRGEAVKVGTAEEVVAVYRDEVRSGKAMRA